MAKNITSVDHKAYFMIFRFTGVEVEVDNYLDKRSRCIQDCDENSSLSCSDDDVSVKKKKVNYEDHINRDLYFEAMASSVYTPRRKKKHRR